MKNHAYVTRTLTDIRVSAEKLLAPTYSDCYFSHEYAPKDIRLDRPTIAYALGADLTAKMLQNVVPVCPPFNWAHKAVTLARRVENALTMVYETRPTPKCGSCVTQAITECLSLTYSENTPTEAIEVLMMPMEYPEMDVLSYISGVVETLHEALLYDTTD